MSVGLLVVRLKYVCMLVTFSLYYNKTNKMYMNADSTMNV